MSLAQILADIYYRNIAIILGFLAAMGLLVLASLPALRWLQRKFSGWQDLCRQLPPMDIGPAEQGVWVDGYVASLRTRNTRPFFVELGQHGFRVTPRFARGLFICVPWSRVTHVSCLDLGFASDACIQLDCEKPVGFHLPITALPKIQQHVPPDRIDGRDLSTATPAQAARGLYDAAKNRARQGREEK